MLGFIDLCASVPFMFDINVRAVLFMFLNGFFVSYDVRSVLYDLSRALYYVTHERGRRPRGML